MNPERLLALYDRVAEAPEAVPRLRRFILDLAVRGKLVEQDPADEPASKLLKRIAAEKARLVKVGKIKRKVALDLPVAGTPFDLPRTWVWVSLGTAFFYDAGIKRSPKALDSSWWLLELEDIEKDSGTLIRRVRVDERASKSTKSEFQPGDILYGKLRPYLNKVLVADASGYSTTEIVALRPYLPLSPGYCALALRRPDFVEYVTKLGQGTKMPRLRTQDAVVAPFPLPPLAEQSRIATKVDELMALCDRLEAARTTREETRDHLTRASLGRLSAPDTDLPTFRSHARFAVNAIPALTRRADQIKQLRRSILDLAVRGKLVEQDPADEPASELLKRIAAEKARLVKAGTIKSRLYPSNGDPIDPPPFVVPKTWNWCRLDAVGCIVGGGTPSAADPTNFAESGEGIPWLTPADLGRYKERYIKRGRRDLTDKGLRSSSATMMPAGTVLFTSRAPIGYVSISASPITTNQGFKSIVPYMADCSHFIALVMQAFAPKIDANAPGTTFREVSGKIVAGIDFPLPPLAEQRRIVAKVNELMSLCDQLETNLEITSKSRQHCLDLLVQNML